MQKLRWMSALLLLVLAASNMSAIAVERTFPPKTQRGNMTILGFPVIAMDAQNLRLAPGARIWNQQQLTQIPASLGNASYLVNYTQDFQGNVDRVWILTKDEASLPVAKQLNNLKW